MLDNLALAVQCYDPDFYPSLQPDTGHVLKKEKKGGGRYLVRVLERNEHGFGERKEQGGTLMSEAVPFLWNLLPFWVADFL